MDQRFRVEVTTSTGGDLYEIEHRTYFDVIDQETGKVVLRYRGADCGQLARQGPAEWTNFAYDGVRSVEISEDGQFALVEHEHHELERVRLPGARKRRRGPSGTD